MMTMAPAKQATTIVAQRALPRPDLARAIWLRPWIVAFSRNSEKMAKFIFEETRSLPRFPLCPQPLLWPYNLTISLTYDYTKQHIFAAIEMFEVFLLTRDKAILRTFPDDGCLHTSHYSKAIQSASVKELFSAFNRFTISSLVFGNKA